MIIEYGEAQHSFYFLNNYSLRLHRSSSSTREQATKLVPRRRNYIRRIHLKSLMVNSPLLLKLSLEFNYSVSVSPCPVGART